MKSAVFGRTGSVMIFILALALMSTLSFADSPPPPPSQVTVHLVANGINETAITQIVYHCTVGANDEVNNISLACIAGTCMNVPHYLPSECVYFPAGYFSYDYRGQNRSSENFNTTNLFKRYYEYRLDVQTGKISLISASDNNGNGPDFPCSTAFIMFVFAMLAGFFISRRG